MVLRQRCSRGLLGLIALISMIGVVLQLLNYDQQISPKKGHYYIVVLLALIVSSCCGIIGMFQKTDRARCIFSIVSLVAPFVLGWSLWETRKLTNNSSVSTANVFIVLFLTSIGALNVALTVQCGKKAKTKNRRSKSQKPEVIVKTKDENGNMIELDDLKSNCLLTSNKHDHDQKSNSTDYDYSNSSGNQRLSSIISATTLPVSRCQNFADRRQCEDVERNMHETMDGLRQIATESENDGNDTRRSCPTYHYTNPANGSNYSGVSRANLQPRANSTAAVVQSPVYPHVNSHYHNLISTNMSMAPSIAESPMPPMLDPTSLSALNTAYGINFSNFSVPHSVCDRTLTPSFTAEAKSVSPIVSGNVGVFRQPFPIRAGELFYPQTTQKYVQPPHGHQPIHSHIQMNQQSASHNLSSNVGMTASAFSPVMCEKMEVD